MAQVSPAELEEVALRHPDIREASCFGIPDPAGGDRIPRLVVVLCKDSKVSADDIRKFVDGKLVKFNQINLMVNDIIYEQVCKFISDQVASYKQIRGGVYIVDSLPRGKTGKVARNLVAEMDLSEALRSS